MASSDQSKTYLSHVSEGVDTPLSSRIDYRVTYRGLAGRVTLTKKEQQDRVYPTLLRHSIASRRGGVRRFCAE